MLAPMRVMESELAILNVAQYQDGPQFHRGRAPGGSVKIPQRDDVSKKRPRAMPVDEPTQDEPEEEKKRSRGRPRLDPTDQTPQDRRRTQIRLAQRAYRNRKESAITTLEKEVDELKEVNEQTRQAYRELFDFATRNGLLEQAPDFGQHLRKLEALSRRSGEYLTKNEEDVGFSDSGAGPKGLQSKANSPPSYTVAPAPSQQQPQHLWGGIMLSHETPAASTQHPNHGIPDISAAPVTQSLGYEIIAQPTSQNASFPQALTFNQPTIFGQSPWMPTPSPWNSMPTPQTYAFQEMTFGRRLQRTAMQCAARLITMSDPPPDTIARVFGFARLFETYEQIRERTLACLESSANEDLSCWKFPIHTYGGAGTHFPEMHSQAQELRTNGTGSSSSPRPGRPKDIAPFSIGPFDTRTSKLRETLVGLGGQINIPGFDGIFWDADEVEFYLLQNGVNIPALVDHWIVEIDEAAFSSPPVEPLPASQDRSHGASLSSASSLSGATSSAGSAGIQSTPSTLRTGSTATTSTSLSTPEMPADSAAISQNAPHEAWLSQGGLGPFALPQDSNVPGMAIFNSDITTSFQDPSLVSPASNGGQFPAFGVMDTQFQGISKPAQSLISGKKVWRIDVEKFLDELVLKCTCLGRTPGFKPRDVDIAFWASVNSPDAI